MAFKHEILIRRIAISGLVVALAGVVAVRAGASVWRPASRRVAEFSPSEREALREAGRKRMSNALAASPPGTGWSAYRP